MVLPGCARAGVWRACSTIYLLSHRKLRSILVELSIVTWYQARAAVFSTSKPRQNYAYSTHLQECLRLAFAAAEPEDIKIELEDLSSYNRWPWIRGTFPAILLNQSSVILLS